MFDFINFRFKVFRILLFVLGDLNFTVSLVQYERFKRERELEAMRCELYIKGGDSECYPEDEVSINKTQQEKTSFFDDVRFMLEYNENGFLQMVIFVAHLFFLVLQILQSIIFSVRPTNRDPETKEFVDPYLRIAERLLIVDFLHEFDPKGLFNKLLAFMLLQYLLLRIRAFYIRLKKSKLNRHQYTSLNIVDFELNYALAFSIKLFDCASEIVKAYKHTCRISETLSNKNRRATLEFAKRARQGGRIDCIYQHNLINFNGCFKTITVLDLYKQKAALLDQELTFKGFNHRLNKGITREKLAILEKVDQQERRKKVDPHNFLFHIDFPGKIGYVSSPIHKIDPLYGFLLIFIYGVGTTFAVFSYCITCTVLSWLAFLVRNGDIDTTFTTLKYLTKPLFISGLIRVHLLLGIILINLYEWALCAYSSVNALSRSEKIVKLLKKEIEFCRSHKRNFRTLYQHQMLASNMYRRLFRTDFKRKSRQYAQFKPSIKRLEYISRVREEQCCSLHIQNADYVEFCDFIETYRKSVSETKLRHHNENLDYLLGLVTVVKCEFDDRRDYFTTYLNLNLVFSCATCSLAIAMSLTAEGIVEMLLAFSGGFLSCVPMIFSLALGVSSEIAVSI